MCEPVIETGSRSFDRVADMYVMFASLQMRGWHDGGLFMGMHWVWWFVWIGTALLLGWGLFRGLTDRRRARRRIGMTEAAEEALRRRFADGEIDEEEFAHRMKVLHDTTPGG